MLDNNLENKDQPINIDEIKEFQNKLDNVSSFEIPKDYGNLDMFDDEGKAKVAVEKEVALSFKRVDDKYIIKTSRTVKNVWDYIDFNFIVGQGRGIMPKSIECRSGTKLNSSWGIDIIQYIYTELKMYDEKEAENFISCLRKIVDELDDDKKNTFNFGLKLIGIEKMVDMSGGMRRILPQESPSTDIENLFQELTNIENHLKEMYVLTYHDDKNDKIKVLNYNLNYNYNQWQATDIIAEPSPIVPVVIPEPYNYYLFYSVIKYYNHIIEHFSRDRNNMNDSYEGIIAKLESINKLITNFDINYWEEPIDDSYHMRIVADTVKMAQIENKYVPMNLDNISIISESIPEPPPPVPIRNKTIKRGMIAWSNNNNMARKRQRGYPPSKYNNMTRGRQRSRYTMPSQYRYNMPSQYKVVSHSRSRSRSRPGSRHPGARPISVNRLRGGKHSTQKKRKTQKKHKTQKRRTKK
jgi:hypothetical protein